MTVVRMRPPVLSAARMSAVDPPDDPGPVDRPLVPGDDAPDDRIPEGTGDDVFAPPPVVVVVVTHDPGPAFEEALAAIASQDYPGLSVLVVDTGSDDDPTERVAGVLPDAFVRRVTASVGFGGAANHALSAVEGASFVLLCH